MNLLSSFNSIITPTLESKPVTVMESVPPNTPPGAPPLPALPTDIPLPHLQVLLDTEKPFKDRLKIVLGKSTETFSAIAHIFWLPLSWILIVVRLGAKLWKNMMSLSFTIFISIYERRIRAKLPGLPSIWLVTNLPFPSGLFLSFTGMRGAPVNYLPTLDIDMDAIRAGYSDAIAGPKSNIQGALV